jgi:hypothetical protein
MDEDDKVVEGEVVDAGGESKAPPPDSPPALKRPFFEPLSGLMILGVDWLAFGADFFSGFVALSVVAVLAFVATFWAVQKLQLRAGDPPRSARFKALLGAMAAGVPFPVTGTIVGAAILALSGLPRSRVK